MRGNERAYGRSRFPPIHQTKAGPRLGNSSAYKLIPSSIPCQYFPASNFRPVLGPRGNFDEMSSFYGRNPLEATSSNLREPTADAVRAFLDTHPDFLARYVREKVPAARLRQWLLQKRKAKMTPGRSGPTPPTEGRITRMGSSPGVSPSAQSVLEKRRLLETIINDPFSESKKLRIFALLKECLSSIVQADGLNVYVVNASSPNTLLRCFTTDEADVRGQEIGQGGTVAAYVAHTKESIRLPDKNFTRGTPDSRFPLLLNSSEEAHYVLCVPVLQEEEKLAGVVELYRFSESEPFLKEDEEVVQSYLIWGGTAVTCSEAKSRMHLICQLNRKQERLNQFILQVTQSMFGKFKDKRHVIEDIMTHAKQLVKADRTSMFIVDRDSEEMVSMYFDNGEGGGETSEQALKERDIRFPLDRGIAGHVAITGETCNIHDAYSDPRFNRDVDQQTGYKTRTILCMPVKLHEQVIGVVQMLNKMDDVFTSEDEEHFKTFASYCGLALHIAKMYERIRVSEQKYKVALEVLSYHSQYEPNELSSLRAMGIPNAINGIESFYYSPWSARELEKPQQVLFMFRDLFGFDKFDCETLMKFTLTVRKNYRRVPYHNWAHAFSVAHAMYTILKTTAHQFTDEEALAMFIGSLCHDLDHRGKTNQYMVRSASPLAEIYSTSTMEHHHFNMTVAILQRDGHNIFQNLDSDKYKEILATIKHCILATDLQRFETHRQQMTAILDSNSFLWSEEEHRLDLMAISMTTCDLCNMFKPWQLQVSLVLVIMDEFWTQGDEEKLQGELPSKMMDRDYRHELPESQVGFIGYVGLPCYTLLSKFLPEAVPCVYGAEENMEGWTKMAALPRDVKEVEITQLEDSVRSWKIQNLCFN